MQHQKLKVTSVKSAYKKIMYKTCVTGTQKNRLHESVLLSTQNICSNWWIRKYKKIRSKIVFIYSMSCSLQLKCSCTRIQKIPPGSVFFFFFFFFFFLSFFKSLTFFTRGPYGLPSSSREILRKPIATCDFPGGGVRTPQDPPIQLLFGTRLE